MKVLVGLSGGVDSAVAALLLKKEGYEVIGVTMSIWRERSGAGVTSSGGCSHGACFGPEEKEDIEHARHIAESIGIPYYVFDCADEYEKIVLDNFKNEYISGRTPNPCIRCNSFVKFGVLPLFAKQNGIEFDKFATGHYAKIEERDGRFFLKRAFALSKDQSYFLYRLKQEQLKDILFPLGNYSKDEVRRIAADNGLGVSDKPDSQDFYEGDYNELLGIEDKTGDIVDIDGNILAKHRGIWNYTIGQRKRLGVSSSKPLYVLELRKDSNEVVVGSIDKTFKKSLIAADLSFSGISEINRPIRACAKIRSAQTPADVLITPMSGDCVRVDFDEYQKSIAAGQSVVFYDGDYVLGGGVIDAVL
ncbi:MAG: tRNA 2-thiouridine(34) synthase MnmA [Candidatus Gastranaerophilales bacterium]|nr:tRNA 2-thiouridine(34) synthase MnmA [Candidatus Gastranaerophilales bacterium]